MELKKQAISGAKWTTLATIVTALIQILRLSILTRFLEKTDFGIVAILTFVLGLTNTFADLGFSAAIMHKKDLSRKEFSSLYWIQFLFFLLLFCIGSSVSHLVARFYEESSISLLLPIVLLDLIFNGFGRLYDTILQKEMLFRTIAIRNISSALLSIIIALGLAMRGYGIYSMIISTLFNTLLLNIWNLVCGQKHIKLEFTLSFKSCIPLAKIGFYQTGTQILDYFAAKFDVLIIGKLLGAETLGVYNLAKELVMKVILMINSIANKVTLPIFAKVQNDHFTLRKTYCQVIGLLSRINFPISMAICILSTQIVAILYGSGYEDVSGIMSVLTIWSLFICIGNPIGNIAIATGKTNLSFIYTIVRILITVPLVYVASTISITAVSWSNVLNALIMFFVGWKMLLKKMIGLSFLEYVNSFKIELLLTVSSAIPIFCVMKFMHITLINSVVEIFVYGFIWLLLYVIANILVRGKNFYRTI